MFYEEKKVSEIKEKLDIKLALNFYQNQSTYRLHIGNKKFYVLNNKGKMARFAEAYYNGKVYTFGAKLNYRKSAYYFDENGAMKTGWINYNNIWYYANSNGVLMKGWQKIGNTWYYLNSDYSMKTGWSKIDGVWYYFKPSGAMTTGWQKINSKWYYFNNSGAMLKGWQKINNRWYYLNSSGEMLTGFNKIQETSGYHAYYFGNDGAMRTGWVQHYDNNGVYGWHYYCETRRYRHDVGMGLTGMQQINNADYCFVDYVMVTNSWQQFGTNWYYYGSDGKALRDCSAVIDGKTYYFEGIRCTNK